MTDALRQGVEALRMGRYPAALDFLSRAIARDASNPDAWHIRGIVSAQIGHTDDALRDMERAAGLAPLRADIAGNMANVLRQAGRLEEALAWYDRSLQADPLRSEVHANRAGNLQALNRLPDALASFDRSLQLRPDSAEAHSGRALVLHELGRYDEALEAHVAACSLNPRLAGVHRNMVVTLIALGRHVDALASCDRSLQLERRDPAIWVNRGLALRGLSRLPEALESFEQALQLSPLLADAYQGAGIALFEMEQPQAALEKLSRAIELRPGFAPFLLARARARHLLDDHDGALADLDAALRLEPDDAETWRVHGNMLRQFGRLTGARRSLERAAALAPSAADCWADLAVSLLDSGALETCLTHCERALQIQPGHVEARFTRSQAHLMLGRLELGWVDYGARWERELLAGKPIVTTRPGWQYGQYTGPVLVWPEQGIGDQVLGASMLSEFLQLAAPLIVQVDSRLVPLLRRSLPAIEFVSQDTTVDERRYTSHLPMGDLGRWTRHNWERFDAAQPFLRVDAERRARLRQELRIPHDTMLWGLSWKSTREGTVGQYKSVPLEALAPLLATPGVLFVNLQYGDTLEENSRLEQMHGRRLLQCESVDNYADLDGLAALIQACDGIITTSNSIAHLAGGLGVRTELLLAPTGKRLWYWCHCRNERSLWYPSITVHEAIFPADAGPARVVLPKPLLELANSGWSRKP